MTTPKGPVRRRGVQVPDLSRELLPELQLTSKLLEETRYIYIVDSLLHFLFLFPSFTRYCKLDSALRTRLILQLRVFSSRRQTITLFPIHQILVAGHFDVHGSIWNIGRADSILPKGMIPISQVEKEMRLYCQLPSCLRLLGLLEYQALGK